MDLSRFLMFCFCFILSFGTSAKGEGVELDLILPGICVVHLLFPGCSLHSHASGGRYQDAGIEQRRETRSLLHAGHSDLEKGKSNGKTVMHHCLLRECGGARPRGSASLVFILSQYYTCFLPPSKRLCSDVLTYSWMTQMGYINLMTISPRFS